VVGDGDSAGTLPFSCSISPLDDFLRVTVALLHDFLTVPISEDTSPVDREEPGSGGRTGDDSSRSVGGLGFKEADDVDDDDEVADDEAVGVEGLERRRENGEIEPGLATTETEADGDGEGRARDTNGEPDSCVGSIGTSRSEMVEVASIDAWKAFKLSNLTNSVTIFSYCFC